MNRTMDRLLWTGKEAAAATAGAINRDFAASGVAVDARRVRPNDLYAPQGTLSVFDAHLAASAGAAALMVPDAAVTSRINLPLLVVTDARDALEDMARVARFRGRAEIAAILGTCGGGMRADALARVLSEQDRTQQGQALSHPLQDVPLWLANLERATRWGVVATGGATVDLVRMTAPDVCWLSPPPRLGPAGAEALARSFEGVGIGSIALLDAEQAHYPRFLAVAKTRGLEVLSYGMKASADARLLSMGVVGSVRTVEATIFGSRLIYRLPVAGPAWAEMSVGVLLAAAAMGADLAWAAETLSTLEPQAMRARPAVLPRLAVAAGGV